MIEWGKDRLHMLRGESPASHCKCVRVYRFITNQSRYDEIAADSLGIVMGRISKLRCIMLTTWLGNDGTAVTSIDLMQSLNEIHSGEQEKRDAYNLQGGIYFSMLESAALTGDKKTGLMELWDQLPKGCSFLFVEDDEESRTEALAELQDLGNAPLRLLEAVKKIGTIIITPLKPAQVNGEMRWAWLEINAQTYEATSVFDNGQHGAMVEVSINPSDFTPFRENDAGNMAVGEIEKLRSRPPCL